MVQMKEQQIDQRSNLRMHKLVDHRMSSWVDQQMCNWFGRQMNVQMDKLFQSDEKVWNYPTIDLSGVKL